MVTSQVNTRSLSGELSPLPEFAATLKATGPPVVGATHSSSHVARSGVTGSVPSAVWWAYDTPVGL